MKHILTCLLLCLSTLPVFAANKTKKSSVDPDGAYKNNCMRCHSAVRQYSPRMTAVIVTHMRVRANMTAEETRAILQYLVDNSPVKRAPVSAYGFK